MKNNNKMKIEFDAISENESFIRTVVVAFITSLDPDMEEISDLKTAVSEAVTNCIIHGYENKGGTVWTEVTIRDHEVTIKIKDTGIGIADIDQAIEPLYTSKPELERSGMGFSLMEAFMDELTVESALGAGTTVTMKKIIGKRGAYGSCN